MSLASFDFGIFRCAWSSLTGFFWSSKDFGIRWFCF